MQSFQNEIRKTRHQTYQHLTKRNIKKKEEDDFKLNIKVLKLSHVYICEYYNNQQEYKIIKKQRKYDLKLKQTTN